MEKLFALEKLQKNNMLKSQFELHDCKDNSYPLIEENERETIIITACNICGKILSMVVFPKIEKEYWV